MDMSAAQHVMWSQSRRVQGQEEFFVQSMVEEHLIIVQHFSRDATPGGARIIPRGVLSYMLAQHLTLHQCCLSQYLSTHHFTSEV
jgi:hypothetical protein